MFGGTSMSHRIGVLHMLKNGLKTEWTGHQSIHWTKGTRQGAQRAL
jgi:hypothetical protein